MMMACARLQIREPIEFHALSVAAQDMWIQFELDMWTGAFRSDATPKQTPAEAREVERKFIEDMRRRRGGP